MRLLVGDVPLAQHGVEPTPEPIHLDRRLGPLDAAAIIVSNVIGGGILFTPPQIAALLPHTWWFLSTWVVGGLLAFVGAMAYAELVALRPRAGGEYVYLREAYGCCSINECPELGMTEVKSGAAKRRMSAHGATEGLVDSGRIMCTSWRSQRCFR